MHHSPNIVNHLILALKQLRLEQKQRPTHKKVAFARIPGFHKQSQTNGIKSL